MGQALRYILFGEGETGLMVYTILVRYWDWTPDEDVRPHIFLMVTKSLASTADFCLYSYVFAALPGGDARAAETSVRAVHSSAVRASSREARAMSFITTTGSIPNVSVSALARLL